MATDPHDFSDQSGSDADWHDVEGESDSDADLCEGYDESGSDGDIRVEYHPKSSRDPEIFTSDEFRKAPPKLDKTDKLDHTPWAPFETREDFEFAALMQRIGASKKDVNDLIHLFKKCISDGGGSLTLSSHEEMVRTLMTASARLPEVMLYFFCTNHIFADHYSSSKRNLCLQPTKKSHMNLMFGYGQCGHGSKTC